MTVPDPMPAGDEPDPVGTQRRRIPSTFGGLVYLGVVAIAGAGFALVAFGPWRTGIVVVGAGFLVGSAMRLVIQEAEAGMLRVRGRAFDVVALAGVGIALIALATNIPDQPGL